MKNYFDFISFSRSLYRYYNEEMKFISLYFLLIVLLALLFFLFQGGAGAFEEGATNAQCDSDDTDIVTAMNNVLSSNSTDTVIQLASVKDILLNYTKNTTVKNDMLNIYNDSSLTDDDRLSQLTDYIHDSINACVKEQSRVNATASADSDE